jgi:hypothetical protein
MIDLVPCTTVGVFGPVCSGKSYLLSRWLENESRFVAFDATGELLEKGGYTEVWASPKKLLQIIEASPHYYRIVYVPGKDLEEDFSWCLRVIWQFSSPKLLAVDEFHLVCPVDSINDDVEMLLRFSRHAKIGLVGMSQRIADVSKLFTSACRMVVLFWTTEARDLLAIRDRWGSEVSEQVANLRPLIFDDATKTTKQVPQCMVLVKGSRPRIYDFQQQKFLGETTREQTEDDDNAIPPSSDVQVPAMPTGNGVSQVASNGSEEVEL